MARITFVLPRFHTNLWFAVRRLQADGHVVQLLVNISGALEDHSFITPVVMGEYPAYSDVHTALEDFKPDIVIIRNAWALSRRASRAARRLKIRTVLYNLIPANKPTSLLRRIKLLYKGLPVHRITPVKNIGAATSERFAQHLPWPVGTLTTDSQTPVKSEKISVLLVGKFGSKRKNQDNFIRTLAQTELLDDIQLTLVGSAPGSENPHYSELKKITQSNSINMMGNIPFKNMGNIYASHDICILPSFNEPLGIAPLEAMAYGVVPLISNQCGSAGYITHGKDGFIFDPNNLTQAVDILRGLRNNPDTLKKLKMAAYDTFQKDLSEDVFSRSFTALLESFRLNKTPVAEQA